MSASNSNRNLTSLNPQLPEGLSSVNFPTSPHSVEENLFSDENFADALEDVLEVEEPEENEDEEDSVEESEEENENPEVEIQPPIQPPLPTPRIRFVFNRPTTGMLTPAAGASTNSPGEATSSTYASMPNQDTYPPPGYIPLPTYPRLAREIGDHDRRLNELEDTVDLFPEPHQIETMSQNLQQFRINQQFDEQRIVNLEDQVDKLRSQVDGINQMIATFFRQ